MDSTINITYDSFKHMPFFAFNFSPDLSHGCGTNGHVNLVKRGSLRLHLKFSKLLPENANLIVLCKFDNLIK